MQIIPAINCLDFECVKQKIKQCAEFSDWAQLDIADGKFTKHLTWNKPAELSSSNPRMPYINLEIHLMVQEPEKTAAEWIRAGAKRIIAHFESASLRRSYILEDFLKRCRENKIEFGLAISPQTEVEKLVQFLAANQELAIENLKFVQILAVEPGKSGQEFDRRSLEKIMFLKKNHPDVKIEVDGGINLETARLCKEAGADILAAASYIWDSDNPAKAYEELAGV